MSEQECRIYQERQNKIHFLKEYFFKEVFSLLPQAFISQQPDDPYELARRIHERTTDY